jgi:hypothetical protein
MKNKNKNNEEVTCRGNVDSARSPPGVAVGQNFQNPDALRTSGVLNFNP